VLTPGSPATHASHRCAAAQRGAARRVAAFARVARSRRAGARRRQRLTVRTLGPCIRQEYIDAHGISKTVEEVINATVKAKASEPCSFMVRRAAATSQPGAAVEG
jgi:hypothetical protein